jgi:hypothetical protein
MLTKPLLRRKVMGKVKTLAERVEWFSDTKDKTCRGVFKQDVGVNFVLDEIKNAPVEYASLESRTKKSAYADDYLVVETAVNLDEDALKEIPFRLLEQIQSPKNPGYKIYKFQVEEPSEQTL